MLLFPVFSFQDNGSLCDTDVIQSLELQQEFTGLQKHEKEALLKAMAMLQRWEIEQLLIAVRLFVRVQRDLYHTKKLVDLVLLHEDDTKQLQFHNTRFSSV
jgi:hypothetical protein